MAIKIISVLFAALLVFGPAEARAASAGVSELGALEPASTTTAESKPMGSSAAPYILVALGIAVALILVVGSADTSDYDCDFGDAC